jgi:hypothetical protein
MIFDQYCDNISFLYKSHLEVALISFVLGFFAVVLRVRDGILWEVSGNGLPVSLDMNVTTYWSKCT